MLLTSCGYTCIQAMCFPGCSVTELNNLWVLVASSHMTYPTIHHVHEASQVLPLHIFHNQNQCDSPKVTQTGWILKSFQMPYLPTSAQLQVLKWKIFPVSNQAMQLPDLSFFLQCKVLSLWNEDCSLSKSWAGWVGLCLCWTQTKETFHIISASHSSCSQMP